MASLYLRREAKEESLLATVRQRPGRECIDLEEGDQVWHSQTSHPWRGGLERDNLQFRPLWMEV